MGTTAFGAAAVLGAIAAFGSFGVPIKSRRLQDAQVQPFVISEFKRPHQASTAHGLGSAKHVQSMTEPVWRLQVHPLVVQCYKTAACFATCWLALLVVPLRFTWWGTAGAAIWVRIWRRICLSPNLWHGPHSCCLASTWHTHSRSTGRRRLPACASLLCAPRRHLILQSCQQLEVRRC
jgi:hypothetical protein